MTALAEPAARRGRPHDGLRARHLRKLPCGRFARFHTAVGTRTVLSRSVPAATQRRGCGSRPGTRRREGPVRLVVPRTRDHGSRPVLVPSSDRSRVITARLGHDAPCPSSPGQLPTPCVAARWIRSVRARCTACRAVPWWRGRWPRPCPRGGIRVGRELRCAIGWLLARPGRPRRGRLVGGAAEFAAEAAPASGGLL